MIYFMKIRMQEICEVRVIGEMQSVRSGFTLDIVIIKMKQCNKNEHKKSQSH